MIEVTRKVELAAAPADVWELVGEFGSLDEWHPAAAACTTETVGGAVQRTITVGDGPRLVEKLESRSDEEMAMSYSIVSGPLPVSNYLSTLGVEQKGEGSEVTWHGRFEAKDVPEERAERIIAGIYEPGLQELKRRFG